MLLIHDVPIDDTFAEAFSMTAARVIVTAVDASWAATAATLATGYGTSVIGCDAEAGIERVMAPHETPDGRPGMSLLFFSINRDALESAVANRVSQCVLTCPTTSCYDGLPEARDKPIRIGGSLRYFGDGFQSSKLLDGRRFWRIPVMDGEFTCEDLFGTAKGVAGGNFLIFGATQEQALEAAKAAVSAIRTIRSVILPFPAGMVRSGSKVGSRYKKLRASTNDAFCPTLRGLASSKLPAKANAAYEIIINGLDKSDVEEATRVGIRAACQPGVVQVSAANFGGKLGRYLIHLHEVLRDQVI